MNIFKALCLITLVSAASAQADWSGKTCFEIQDIVHSGEILPPQKACIESLSLKATATGKAMLVVKGSPSVTGEFEYRQDERGIRATVWNRQDGGDACNRSDGAYLELVVQLNAQDEILAPLSMNGGTYYNYDVCHSSDEITEIRYVGLAN